MSNKSTLETFKEAKERLLTEYKTKELELATLRKELVSIGVITGDGRTARGTGNGRRKRRKMSAASRAKIAAAQRARWAKKKAHK